MASNPLKRVSSTDGDISPPQTKRKIATTSAAGPIANFFKPASEKAPPKVAFSTVQDSLLVGSYDGAAKVVWSAPVKIAAFDLDDTIITTKSGNRFARDENDWKWWHAKVPGRLQELHAEGFTIVFISNQAGISLRTDSKTLKGDMKSLSKFKAKVTTVLDALSLPITVYAATEKDLFRKPRTGMWEQMLRGHALASDGVKLESCFFVGDAGGRQANKALGIVKDHSCSDRDFAANVGMKYHTPEEYFLGKEVMPYTRLFNPLDFARSITSPEMEQPQVLFEKKSKVELVLFCGSPGSGKSTFYWRHMQPLGYERVNQDILKTRPKCLRLAEQYIEGSKSVVVDNTNADIDTRAEWVKLAQRHSIPVRLIRFTAPASLCEHNDAVRGLSVGTVNPEARTVLPKIAFSSFATRLTEPQPKEGFEDITTVDFKFEGTEEQRTAWTKFWVS